MNILFIGSSTTLSFIPLRTLIESKYTICAFAFDELNSELNVINTDSIQSLAFDNSIPLIKIDKNYSNATSQIKALKPDIIFVSCYARLLPQSILSLAKIGCFNAHPSLLPKFRGPNPLFWQFHEGDNNFGVTLHRISQEFDAGSIVSQKSTKFIDGINYNDCIKLLAIIASELIINLLNDLENEIIDEHEFIDEHSQNHSLASYQSYPTKDDYEINVYWSAKRIYNFISAYKNNSIEFICKLNGQEVKIIDVYSYQDSPYEGMKNKMVVQEKDVIKFSCKSGYIECLIKDD